MTTISEEQASKLLDDLASIKSIIGENKSVMKQLLLPIHFRFIWKAITRIFGTRRVRCGCTGIRNNWC